jgi:hypothetical protein
VNERESTNAQDDGINTENNELRAMEQTAEYELRFRYDKWAGE